MSETFWWHNYGSYHPWKKYPTLPDPGQVLLSYMDRRRIAPEQRVFSLMKLLGLQKSMAYKILQGDGLDSISRRRQLVRKLEIYPPLLGIDAKYCPIEHHPYWWKEYGYKFIADDQGYPETHEIIAYFRSKTVKGGIKTEERWSQVDLGDACGLKKETIYRLEHDRNPYVFDSVSRRFIVALVFGRVLEENESIIFRLFGLSPEAYGVSVSPSDYLPPVHFLRGKRTSTILDEYKQKLTTFFTEYYDGHGQNRVVEVRQWLLQLPALEGRADTTALQIHLLALQSRAHRFLACIAREECEKERVLTHTNKAIELADQVLTLYNSQRVCDRALLVTTYDLLASARLTAAMAYYEQGSLNLAREHIERALAGPSVNSVNLKNELYGIIALIRAYTVNSPMDQQMVLSYIDLAQSLPSRCGSLDENFFRGGKCALLIYKAWALFSPKMEGVTGVSVLETLEEAARYSPQIRQQILIEYLQALVSLVQGDYQQSVEYATSALEKSKQIRSRLNKHRIEELYQHLLQASFRGQPCLVSLGVNLRLWDCEVQTGWIF